MTKTIILFLNLCVLLIFLFIHTNKVHADDAANDYFIYQCIQAEGSDKLNLIDLDLKKYNLKKINQYIFLNSGNLFLLGISDTKMMNLLSINLKEQKAILIKKYPAYMTWAADEARFYIVVTKQKGKSMSFIVVEYTQGNVARDIDEKERYIDIVYFDDFNQFRLIGEEKIAANNIVFTIIDDPQYKYFHLAFDNSEGSEVQINPARLENVITKFSDCNWDGYPDILIWKTVSYSRLIEERNKPDFPIHHEELSVMYYLPQENKFTGPMPVDWN